MVEMTTRLSEIFMAEATSLMRELDRVMGLRDLALKSLSPFGKRLKDFFGRKTRKAATRKSGNLSSEEQIR